VLVMDGCSSHFSVELLVAAMMSQVLVVCLPPNGTVGGQLLTRELLHARAEEATKKTPTAKQATTKGAKQQKQKSRAERAVPVPSPTVTSIEAANNVPIESGIEVVV
jgi:hypothetical protein